MPARPSVVDVSSRGSTAVVRCSGELDIATRGALRVAIDEALSLAPRRLVVDCDEVGFIESSTIQELLDAAARCRSRDISFELAAAGRVRRVLDMAGLWWLGVIEDGLALAVALDEVDRDPDQAGESV
ncbi:MAG: STAS domain-containing protein [Actinomycetota bacterium]